MEGEVDRAVIAPYGTRPADTVKELTLAQLATIRLHGFDVRVDGNGSAVVFVPGETQYVASAYGTDPYLWDFSTPYDRRRGWPPGSRDWCTSDRLVQLLAGGE